MLERSDVEISVDLKTYDGLLAVAGRARIHEIDQALLLGHSSAVVADQINDDLRCLEGILLQLKARRNACLPFFSVPPEVLGEILTIVALINPPTPPKRPLSSTNNHRGFSQKHQPRSDHLGWIKTGHVCRKLRNVPLSIPALWAGVVTLVPCVHKELLARVGSMPITIQTNTCRDLVPLATIRFAQENVCRAKVIEIVDPIDNPLVWDSDILDELRRPSTLPLERLVVELQRPRLTSHPSRSFTTLNTPFLRHVSLTNTFIPITSSLLTYLEIVHNPPLSISSALPWSLLW
ncbi:hypothetical protein OF83DRAFT_1085130 [Amylostereum chailletii]|nr:hypothetical protein OF83DRAFT_1085130 [Amylostereum chailletii]